MAVNVPNMLALVFTGHWMDKMLVFVKTASLSPSLALSSDR